jgi:DNA invertase Pin-like site-specific DNA recombinase
VRQRNARSCTREGNCSKKRRCPNFGCTSALRFRRVPGHAAQMLQVDTSTPTGKMVFTVLGAVAELERSLIVERVRAGLRNARAKGKKLARPRKVTSPEAIRRMRTEGATWRAIGKRLGVSPATALHTATRAAKLV